MSEQQCYLTLRKPSLYRISITQICALTPVFLLMFLLWPLLAMSAIAGLFVEITTRAYFNFYAFRHVGAKQMSQVARAFRQGATGKFVLAILLFALVFSSCRWISAPMFFFGYVAAWFLGMAFSAKLIGSYQA